MCPNMMNNAIDIVLTFLSTLIGAFLGFFLGILSQNIFKKKVDEKDRKKWSYLLVTELKKINETNIETIHNYFNCSILESIINNGVIKLLSDEICSDITFIYDKCKNANTLINMYFIDETKVKTEKLHEYVGELKQEAAELIKKLQLL